MTDTTNTPTDRSRHQLSTRLLHAGLALAVITQLVTSLVLHPAEDGQAGNFAFEVHEYAGLAAFVIVLGFWILVAARHRGTSAAVLWPWFSSSRLAALWDDIKLHLATARKGNIPDHDDAAALPSAIHGLGIALVTAMAATGTIYYFINQGNPDAGGLVGVVMFIHTSLANLVWAYLIGHAGFAVLQHFFNGYSLRNMWSLTKTPSKGN